MGRPKQAIIVAAGVGSRLRPLTNDLPKSLIEVDGQSILRRSIHQMIGHGIKDIAVVVGYRKEMIIEHIRDFPVTFFYNPFYKITNNMASLWFAAPFIKGDFIYSHSDIVYDVPLLTKLMEDRRENILLVEKKECGAEEMKVQVEDGCLVASSKEIPRERSYGEWTGLARFSAVFGARLMEIISHLIEQGHQMAYDTLAFNRTVEQGSVIEIASFTGLNWIEIDSIDDLQQAHELFVTA
ncbi:MAG: phosphocholine cytidylyltransferase family protein [Fidelibacterota bacterium]|nr:MAG: phosphocholine cytidylyltransferase family protein [Candidatus Neomarinimicrobiota bacterium]